MSSNPFQLNTQQQGLLSQQPNTGTTDWLAALNKWAQGATSDPSVLATVSGSTVLAIIGVMAAAGIVDLGADPLDTAAGISIARVLSPFIDALLTEPITYSLHKFIRYKGPNVAQVTNLLADGTLTAAAARDALERDGIAEPFIIPIISRGLLKFNKANLQDSQAADSETFKVQLAAVTTQLDLLKDDISTFSTEAKAARTKYLTYSRRLKRSQGTESLNQGYIDDSRADAATALDDINAAIAVLNELSIPDGAELRIKAQPPIPTNYTPVDVANLAYWLRDLHIAIGRAWAESNLALLNSQHAEISALKAKQLEIPGPSTAYTPKVTPDPFTGLSYSSATGNAITLTGPATAKTGDIIQIGVNIHLATLGTYNSDVKDGSTIQFLGPMISAMYAQDYTTSFFYTMPATNVTLVGDLYSLGNATPISQGVLSITNSLLAPVVTPPVVTPPVVTPPVVTPPVVTPPVVTPPVIPGVTGLKAPTSFTISSDTTIPAGSDIGLMLHVVGAPGSVYSFKVSYMLNQVRTGTITLSYSGLASSPLTSVKPSASGALTAQLMDPSSGTILATVTKTITVIPSGVTKQPTVM
jgi:hypothetical protein